MARYENAPMRGGYPNEETWGGPYTGYTRCDSGYLSRIPGWPWGVAQAAEGYKCDR